MSDVEPADRGKLAIELVRSDAYRGYLAARLEERQATLLEKMSAEKAPLPYEEYLKAWAGFNELRWLHQRIKGDAARAAGRGEDV